MQSAPHSFEGLLSTWLPILHTQLQTSLHNQGRIEGKIDTVLLLVKTGHGSLPPGSPSTATSTSMGDSPMGMLDPHKLGKWLSLTSTAIRFGIMIGPFVTIAAKVVWKAVKPWLVG
jgi:hypothetical protein